MINQDRVREMSRMAMLETGTGEKELRISSFRRVDYILLEAAKGIFMGTVCFGGLCLAWFCLTWDSLNEYFADADFIGFAQGVIKYYIIFMAAYVALCAVVAFVRHKKCSGRKKIYMKHLNRLGRSYRSEDKRK